MDFQLCRLFLTAAVCGFVTLGSTSLTRAQQFQVGGLAGYQWGGGFDKSRSATGDVTQIDLNIDNGVGFGLTVDTPVSQKGYLTFLIAYQNTNMNAREAGTADATTLFNLDLYYVHAGFLYEFGAGGLRPFAGIGAGITYFNGQSGYGNDTRASGSLFVGVKKFVNAHVGLRAQAAFLGTYVPSGEVFCDGLNNCFTFTNSSLMTQFHVTAGLIVAFKL